LTGEHLRAAHTSASTHRRDLLRRSHLLRGDGRLHGVDEPIPDPRLVLAFWRRDSDSVRCIVTLDALHAPGSRVAEAFGVAILVDRVEDVFRRAAADVHFAIAEADLGVTAVGRRPDCWSGVGALYGDGGGSAKGGEEEGSGKGMHVEDERLAES